MARTKVVQERDALARRVRELQNTNLQLISARTERDRALPQLKCAEAERDTNAKINARLMTELGAERIAVGRLRAAIVNLALLLEKSAATGGQ